MKTNEVYTWRYTDQYIKNLSYPYHCKERLAIVKKDCNGKLIYADMYWSSNNFVFRKEDIGSKIVVEYYCNLNYLEKYHSKDPGKYYNQKDIFVLHSQNGYRKQYYIKKGAKRSKKAMRTWVMRKIDACEREMEMSQRYIVKYKEDLSKINTDINNVSLF